MIFTRKIPPTHLGRLHKALGQNIRRMIRTTMASVSTPVIQLAKMRTLQLDVYDLGKVFRGWYTRQPSYDELVLDNRAKHLVFVQMGRRAGARRPPSSALIPWVKRRFGVSDKKAAGLAFVIARKIGERGIRARQISNHRPLQRTIAKMTRERLTRMMELELRRRHDAP